MQVVLQARAGALLSPSLSVAAVNITADTVKQHSNKQALWLPRAIAPLASFPWRAGLLAPVWTAPLGGARAERGAGAAGKHPL
eukprot:SAG31_NODE_998_length_10460_cov_255.143505_4_plen_83_part_00